MIGWKDCNDHGGMWSEAYSGYLMTIWSNKRRQLSSAQSVCVDKVAIPYTGYGVDPDAPEVSFIRSGAGFWMKDKIIPCTVCSSAVPTQSRVMSTPTTSTEAPQRIANPGTSVRRTIPRGSLNTNLRNIVSP